MAVVALRRLVEFDALRFEPLHKGGVVLHVEAKVVENAALPDEGRQTTLPGAAIEI